MRRKIVGYVLAASAIVVCPCHLAITLPILIGLLGGTALGTTLAAHTSLVVAGASAYFVAALAAGFYLISHRKHQKESDKGEACSLPAGPESRHRPRKEVSRR
jgi:amino acid transporter